MASHFQDIIRWSHFPFTALISRWQGERHWLFHQSRKSQVSKQQQSDRLTHRRYHPRFLPHFTRSSHQQSKGHLNKPLRMPRIGHYQWERRIRHKESPHPWPVIPWSIRSLSQFESHHWRPTKMQIWALSQAHHKPNSPVSAYATQKHPSSCPSSTLTPHAIVVTYNQNQHSKVAASLMIFS